MPSKYKLHILHRSTWTYYFIPSSSAVQSVSGRIFFLLRNSPSLCHQTEVMINRLRVLQMKVIGKKIQQKKKKKKEKEKKNNGLDLLWPAWTSYPFLLMIKCFSKTRPLFCDTLSHTKWRCTNHLISPVSWLISCLNFSVSLWSCLFSARIWRQ